MEYSTLIDKNHRRDRHRPPRLPRQLFLHRPRAHPPRLRQRNRHDPQLGTKSRSAVEDRGRHVLDCLREERKPASIHVHREGLERRRRSRSQASRERHARPTHLQRKQSSRRARILGVQRREETKLYHDVHQSCVCPSSSNHPIEKNEAVLIWPRFVIGPPLLAPKSPSEVSETIATIWAIFSGAPHPQPVAGLPYTVDVRDVAALLLYPIEHPQETNGERYIASGAAGDPQAIADILRREFPEARNRIVEGTPGQGYTEKFEADPQTTTLVDASKGEKLIGGWTGYEKSVVDTARQFVGLV